MSAQSVQILAQELRHAMRRLGREPGFAAAAILILAVGIGACTAMFSIVHAVLLRPFAVRSPDRIVMLWSMDTRHQAVGELTYSARRELLGPMQSFEDIALVGAVNWSGTLRLPGTTPVAWSCSAVSGTFFAGLGASPRSGAPLLRQTTAERGDRRRQLLAGAPRGRDRSAGGVEGSVGGVRTGALHRMIRRFVGGAGGVLGANVITPSW